MTLTTTQTVPLTDAKKWAEEWQSTNPDKAKAFLIPMGDIINILKEMNVLVPDSGSNYVLNMDENQGIRAYMAIEEDQIPNPGSDEKLLMVGTQYDPATKTHYDIVEDGNCPVPVEFKGSGVYDFTKPCPNHCDMGSPLYNPSV